LHALATRICGFPVPSSCLSFAKIFIWTEASTSCLVSEGSQVAYSLIYVDDIILTASSTTLLQQIIASILYVIQLLERAHMANYNPSRTLVDTESKLGPEGIPVHDPTLYSNLAGGVQYLTFTRLGLSYAVQQIFLYMHNPRESHLVPLNMHIGQVAPLYDGPLLVIVFLGDNLLSWSSKRQQTLSRLSVKAEYHGVANVVAETIWLCNLLRELHSPLSTTTLVYYNNVSAIYLFTNPVQHQRTKHIEIDIHFVHDMVTTGQVGVLHVPSHYQYVDIFTNGLPSALFKEFRSNLSICLPPAPTTGEY
ncbi:ribonuclease H-like domain-containing protein, partial [Tanacetum coccineum]